MWRICGQRLRPQMEVVLMVWISSALLPWFLCLSFLPSRVALTTDSPTSAAATSISTVATPPTVNNNNTTLLFEGSAP
ncbi:hypothetical protein CRUP_032038, partial [Coryphaenoides rupestris]